MEQGGFDAAGVGDPSDVEGVELAVVAEPVVSNGVMASAVDDGAVASPIVARTAAGPIVDEGPVWSMEVVTTAGLLLTWLWF